MAECQLEMWNHQMISTSGLEKISIICEFKNENISILKIFQISQNHEQTCLKKIKIKIPSKVQRLNNISSSSALWVIKRHRRRKKNHFTSDNPTNSTLPVPFSHFLHDFSIFLSSCFDRFESFVDWKVSNNSPALCLNTCILSLLSCQPKFKTRPSSGVHDRRIMIGLHGVVALSWMRHVRSIYPTYIFRIQSVLFFSFPGQVLDLFVVVLCTRNSPVEVRGLYKLGFSLKEFYSNVDLIRGNFLHLFTSSSWIFEKLRKKSISEVWKTKKSRKSEKILLIKENKKLMKISLICED